MVVDHALGHSPLRGLLAWLSGLSPIAIAGVAGGILVAIVVCGGLLGYVAAFSSGARAARVRADRRAAVHERPLIPGATGHGDRALAVSRPLRCSVGVMAYNEEANIANAIRSVLSQRLSTCEIVEVVVVASGCTDGTVDRVLAVAREDSRVALIVEERRAGKASAINRFIETARCPLLVMVSADVVVADGAIEGLARHFHDPQVGMVGGHPVPVNDASTFLGHTSCGASMTRSPARRRSSARSWRSGTWCRRSRPTLPWTRCPSSRGSPIRATASSTNPARWCPTVARRRSPTSSGSAGASPPATVTWRGTRATRHPR
jgi:hypothetical protein